MIISTLEENLKETKHSRIVMEEEYKITIEKYVKEVRETHIKLTKVSTYLFIYWMGFSRKKNVTPLLRISMENSRGGTPKIEEKNPGGQIQKIDILNRREGGTILFWKSPIFTQDITFNSNEDDESSIHQSGVCPPYLKTRIGPSVSCRFLNPGLVYWIDVLIN